MSIIGSNILAGAAGSGVSAYEIEQSLRFDGSAYIQYPDASFGNETGTYSFWVKRSELGAENTILWNTRVGGHWGFRFDGADTFTLFKTASGTDSSTTTTAVFRDPSAWYHILVTTTSTANEIFVNGTSVATGSYEWAWIDANPRIGYRSSTDSFQGYLAEWHYISGSVKSVSDFTETDDNGVLRPIEYEGSYGTNGYYLKFDPSLTNGILHDSSGQGNHFDSSTGITTSGTGTDVMSDTPTTNWCTLNPLTTGSAATLSNGNLDVLGNTTSSAGNTRTTFVVTTGKFYFETTLTANSYSTYPQIGMMREVDGNRPNNDYPQAGYSNEAIYTDQSVVYQSNGTKLINRVESSYGDSFTNNDTIGVAYDGDNGAIYFSKNGTWQNSGDPTSGASKTGAALTWTDDRDYVFSSAHVNTAASYNFGQRAFAYTPPTGFKALNTSNLPAPDIADGSEYFDTVLWTGNQTARTISMNSTFTPDFIWIKNRTSGYNHSLQDIVRGYGPSTKLNSNTTAQENAANTEPQAGYVDSVAAGSFDIDASATATWYHNNLNSNAYVGWCWDAGGSGSSNTDGSITSTVSANPSAGFSIVSYEGNGTTGATVAHGLGVAPSIIIIKNRSDTTSSFWCVYHKSAYVSASDPNVLYLNSTQAQTDDTNVWGSAPDFNSTTFKLGDYNGSNGSGDDHIAYCFAEVEGYSKFGSYTGNGSSDGPFVFTGHKVAWLLIKNASSASTNWTIIDSARSTYNPAEAYLKPNASQAETNLLDIDMLSNGFKLRGTSGGDHNQSGDTYIFASFAENPFGGSGVSPATAR